jgi:hypothetical protein
MMPEGSQEPRNEMTAAVDALVLQLIAHVPVYRDDAGAWLVPLHPLLETTALTLFHPQASTLADGTTLLLVPLGEALAVLPFSRHFPEALAQVMRIEAVRTATHY